MYYGVIKKNDIANGPGVRVNLFVSGCTHKCEECFNADTWDFKYGQEYTKKQTDEILEALKPEYVAGMTFLGGEPMECANRGVVLDLSRQIKSLYPYKTIWIYSGYLVEELMARAGIWTPDKVPTYDEVPRNRVLPDYEPAPDAASLAELLKLTDVIVDGEFMKEKKNLRLKFRGSENQRIIDMKETIKSGKIVLADYPDR
ncbi:MAG: anaerobic ribonucleoside-triphosphate reductase activating protein [Lachnospiraceae bacterium]|nr:anaerobic ribonucleoside-triphosphate reductase activating protein [Lachnospiraceae bacterium]